MLINFATPNHDMIEQLVHNAVSNTVCSIWTKEKYCSDFYLDKIIVYVFLHIQQKDKDGVLTNMFKFHYIYKPVCFLVYILLSK